MKSKSHKPPIRGEERRILVYADWAWLKERPALMGSLYANSVRGSEVFSFEYDGAWLKSTAAQTLDPDTTRALTNTPHWQAYLDSRRAMERTRDEVEKFAEVMKRLAEEEEI